MSCQSKHAEVGKRQSWSYLCRFIPLLHVCIWNRGSHTLFPQRCISLCSVPVLLKMSRDCVKRDAQPPVHLFQVEWCVLNTVEELGKAVMTILLRAIECQPEELDASLPACATYLLYGINKFLHHMWSLTACSQLYQYLTWDSRVWSGEVLSAHSCSKTQWELCSEYLKNYIMVSTLTN